MDQGKPIRIAALTAGKDIAASRFRIRQYIGHLEKLGICVTEHVPRFGESCGLPSPFKIASRIPALFATRGADAVWMSRELVQGYETFERLLKRPRILDVDDAIWLRRPFCPVVMPHIARGMDAVIAGNNYLAEWFGRYCRNVYVVPTAIDTQRYQLRPEQTPQPDKFVIGWTGQACTFQYLKPIEEVLGRFLKDHADAQIHIIANRPWKPESIDHERITFIPWSRGTEVSSLHSVSVGIMPLKDDKWTRGKCSFKMLQYMAVGLPVIVSPTGMNAEVLDKGEIGFSTVSDGQWYDALKSLYENRDLAKQMGLNGRRVIEQFYNSDTVAEQLAEIFRKTVIG